jgi:hypothetical protein
MSLDDVRGALSRRFRRLITIVMRHSAATLSTLLLCGCTTVSPPADCFLNSGDSVGWTLLRKPPNGSDQMRRLAHDNSAGNSESRRAEYWFTDFDGSVMLCEATRKNGCNTTTTTFDRDASGAMVKSNTGLQFVCVSGESR